MSLLQNINEENSIRATELLQKQTEHNKQETIKNRAIEILHKSIGKLENGKITTNELKQELLNVINILKGN
jgi:site-specific recombinase